SVKEGSSPARGGRAFLPGGLRPPQPRIRSHAASPAKCPTPPRRSSSPLPPPAERAHRPLPNRGWSGRRGRLGPFLSTAPTPTPPPPRSHGSGRGAADGHDDGPARMRPEPQRGLRTRQDARPQVRTLRIGQPVP